jgi:hypothetical protein
MKIFRYFFLIFILTPSISQAKKRIQFFSEVEFEVDFNITQPLLTGKFLPKLGKQILLIGERVRVENNQKSDKRDQVVDASLVTKKSNNIGRKSTPKKYNIAAVFSYNSEKQRYEKFIEMEIPLKTIGYDLLADFEGLTKLIVLDMDGLSYLDFESSSLVSLPETSSIFIESSPQFISNKKMVRDVNGDGLDDILVFDFRELHLFLQQQDGKFIENRLPINSAVEMGRNSISYSAPQIFNFDTNFDKLRDLAIVNNGTLQVFEQTMSGSFEKTNRTIELPKNVSARAWWAKKGADGQSLDQSNLVHWMVDSVQDLNGDDVADLMIKKTKSSGALDRKNTYEIYFGESRDGRLSFSTGISTHIATDGAVSGLKIYDVNDDGKMEILVSSLEIGVSQIIGALMSGSIDQDVNIYSLNDKQQFGRDPIFSEEVDLTFSVSSGQSGQPVILSTDLNGDGKKELLLSIGEKKLGIYLAGKHNKLLSHRPKKHRIQLPQDGSMITTADLNGDSKQEILVRYGKQDKPRFRNKVVVLSVN